MVVDMYLHNHWLFAGSTLLQNDIMLYFSIGFVVVVVCCCFRGGGVKKLWCTSSVCILSEKIAATNGTHSGHKWAQDTIIYFHSSQKVKVKVMT